MAAQNNTPLISVVIVNYKVPDEISQLLRSLQQAELYDKTEVIIVDNASQDNSHDIITKEFPDITWIPLKNNIGFGKACNVGTQNSKGTYLLFLNPDTLISQNTLRISVDFLESHPDVGIMGPKIIKPDGTFQPHSRRSFPTPFNAFTYLFGLSKLFPKSKLFGQYNLTYLDPDIGMEVDAISGSFMFLRREIIQDVGYLDEDYFMYCEDVDYCYRIKKSGWKIYYIPDSSLIHYKGESTKKNDLDYQQSPHMLITKIDTPPYWATMISMARHYTCGGLRVGGKRWTNVLDRWGNIIPRYFAAGEVTGGFHGTNRLGCNAILECIVAGRWAGIAASENI